MIAADRNRIPLRHLAFAERHDVGDDAQRRARRIDVGAARDIFLQDVVLHRPREGAGRNSLSPRDGHVERQQNDGGRVDRHRRRDAVERDAVKQRGHILDGVDRDAHAPHFPSGERVVRVVADLRRQVERDTQPADALRQEIPVATVRLRRIGKPCVLPHRPRPSAIHRRLDPSGVWKPAGNTAVSLWIAVWDVVRRTVEPVGRTARHGGAWRFYLHPLWSG